MPQEKAVEMVERLRPSIIAYSGMTFENHGLQRFNRVLKQRGLEFISIFGGPHYTFNPQEMINDDAMDAVCIGEGEEAFRAFIRSVRDGKEYHRIEKLWVRRGEEIVRNPVGSLISDLDTVPFADRDLIPMDYKADHIQGNSMAMMISRGCPHRCSYCFNARYNKIFPSSSRYRYRSVDNVMKELGSICKKYRLDYVIFCDDTVSYLPKDFLGEFCRKYKQEINKPFCCMFRAEALTEDILVMLKDAGLYFTLVAVECANDEVARTVLRRGNVTKEHVRQAFHLFHKHGIKTWSLNMLGLPVSDPLKVDWETIRFSMQLKPTYAHFTILLAMPDTDIYDYAVENGYLNAGSFPATSKMPSPLTRTRLDFKDSSVTRRINNLHKFASILVKYPFLEPVVKLLIVLPLTPVYQYLFFIWYGYWITIGSFRPKLSSRIVFNGFAAMRQFLKNYG